MRYARRDSNIKPNLLRFLLLTEHLTCCISIQLQTADSLTSAPAAHGPLSVCDPTRI